jgi:prepilin-type N-terminal cleavage/methylation domain-containing protein
VSKQRRLVAFTGFRSILNSEQGLNLIEVLVALSILGAVAVTFLLGMSTSSKAVVTNKVQVSAEGLAKSQMEYIQTQTYDTVHNPPQYTVLIPAQIPAGYGIQITAARLDPQSLHTGIDEGLQKITVNVNNGGRVVFTLEGYKCYTGQ